ncbi:ATP-binding protein [Palaeococcus sp. (in: euryarchaeotes)]
MLKREEIIEALAPYNFWNRERDVGIDREEYLSKLEHFKNANDFILSVVGVRRAGKTTIAKQFIKKAIEDGTDPRDTLYVNLEDPKFHAYLSTELLEEIYRAFKVYVSRGDSAVIVLDEVQNVPNWEKWVRATMEKERVKILVTGSTSRIIKRELATVLTGRTLTVEVFPLDFKEFLTFKGITTEDYLTMMVEKSKIEKALLEYLEFGGFPQVVLSRDELLKREIIKELFEGIVLRDVAYRGGFRDANAVKLIAELAVNRFASLTSATRLKNEVSGILKRNVSPNFVDAVLDALEEVYLAFRVPPFSHKIKEVRRHPKKLYIIDTGIINAVALRFSENLGRLAENLVAIHLIKRHGKDSVFYYKGKGEVDFIVKHGLEIKEAIQVSWDIEKSKKREISALLEALREFDLREGLIVTERTEGVEEVEGKRIKYTPLWKFLLGEINEDRDE